MGSSRRFALICSVVGSILAASSPSLADTCASKQVVARQISKLAAQQGIEKPEFRITEQKDGQALLYWRHGMDSRSFYAVTFRGNGCAVLTGSGQLRRFVFPRSAYNTGVFEEMAAFDGAG